MSSPQSIKKAKLIIAIIYPENNKPTELMMELKGLYGEFTPSEVIDFNYTKFYEKEFGKNLKKIYLAFEKEFDIEKLPKIKLQCYDFEKRYLKNDKRFYNIDPGYITKNSFVLASFKERAHRIYLKDNVYADLQLVYENKHWKSFNWTFPDVKEKIIQEFLKQIRKSL